jgi:UDP-N-acetylmuramoyl-tripeptide--D-alanyl-D-alanine ligase
MPRFDPAELARWTGGTWTQVPRGALTGFGADSRQLVPGHVFVALHTARRDGHDFVAAAAAAGAAGAVVARAIPAAADLPQLVVADPLAALQAIAREHRRAAGATVIGISGSAGKTSTKDLLARLLGGPPETLATEGNLNNLLGVPLTLTRLETGVTRQAVIEAGIDRPGEMARLAATIEPDHGIITLVGAAHLERLGGLEGVAREKCVLLSSVRAGGLKVFPASVAAHAPFRELPGPVLVIVPPGEEPPPARAGWRLLPLCLENSAENPALGTVLSLGAPALARRFRLRRASGGQAVNAALALALAGELGVSDEQLQLRLAGWAPGALRGELRTQGAASVYLDCYNANPASMRDALAHFAAITPPAWPRRYVLGGMEELGNDAAGYHRAVGAGLVLREGDEAWLLGPHAAAYAEGLRAAGAGARQIHLVEDLAPVRAALAGFAGAVFVKGSRRYRLETLWEESSPATAPVSLATPLTAARPADA